MNDVLLMKMIKTFENLPQKHGRCCFVDLVMTGEVFKQLAARHSGRTSHVIVVIPAVTGTGTVGFEFNTLQVISRMILQVR